MAQLDIKQIRGASQGSILFLGTNSIVSEDFNKLNWSQSTNTFTINGNIKITDGNQQNNYILRSDSTGVGTWVDPKTVAVVGTGSTGYGAYWNTIDEISYMNISVSQSTGDIRYINFDTSYAVAPASPGVISWNSNDGTFDIGLNNGVVLQTGQEQHYYVKNQTGTTLLAGRVVSSNGTLGASGRILVTYSIANGSVDPHYVMGILTQTLTTGSDGYVTEFGSLKGIDTTGSLYGETWSDGDILWVSPTIPGGMTKVRPQAPNHKTIIALVINAASNGTLFIRPTFASNLSTNNQVEYDENLLTNDSILRWNDSNNRWEASTYSFNYLSDVNIISATTNDTLRYDGSNWVNNSFITADGAGTFSINGSFIYDDGSQQAGYILTTDANGLATWSQSQTITEIIISGTQNGVNKNFVLSSALTYPQNLFFINGQLVQQSVDYIISGTALTIDPDRPAPVESDTLRLFGSVAPLTGGGILSLSGLSTTYQYFSASTPNNNINLNINSVIDTHTFVASVNFNDIGTSSNDVWSAQQIINYVGSSTASTGTSGTSGNSGTSGTSGVNGTSGTSGNSGTSGSSGANGTSGSSGANGTSGTSGAEGTSGSSGANGTSGTSGAEGTSGSSGANGTSGTSGAEGTSGTSGDNGTSGTSGDNGTSGTSGQTGTSGTSGANGTSGTSGAEGTSGSSGANGTSGTSGAEGTSGSSGVNGTSGTSGQTGTSGTSGQTGTSGTSGQTGTSGTSGQTGTSGTSGQTGTSGTSGAEGTSGSSGQTGTSGSSGQTGTSGTSGAEGTSGTSGVNGTSGSAGTSGAAGTSGTSAAGGSITLNGLTQSIQFFTASNDLNVHLNIDSVGSTHSFNLSWDGLLPLDRGGLSNSTFTASQVLIVNSTTSSVVSSGYIIDDNLITNSNLISAQKVIEYTYAIGIIMG